MNYADWLKTLPPEITEDVLWRMEVYRLSLFLSDLSWHDATRLMRDQRTVRPADQLDPAAGSIRANLSEGYRRQPKKDQARYHEYAPGSARESRGCYFKGRHVLEEPVTSRRLNITPQIIRHLPRIIPAERGPMLKEDAHEYTSSGEAGDSDRVLKHVPMPEPTFDAIHNT